MVKWRQHLSSIFISSCVLLLLLQLLFFFSFDLLLLDSILHWIWRIRCCVFFFYRRHSLSLARSFVVFYSVHFRFLLLDETFSCIRHPQHHLLLFSLIFHNASSSSHRLSCYFFFFLYFCLCACSFCYAMLPGFNGYCSIFF